MQELIAAKSMTYGTRRLTAGDLFTASNRDARLLMGLQRAREVQVEAEAAPAPQAQPTPAPKASKPKVARKRPAKPQPKAS